MPLFAFKSWILRRDDLQNSMYIKRQANHLNAFKLYFFKKIKTLHMALIIIFLSLFFVSCGFLNPETNPADNQENNQKTNSDQMQIASLKSELANLKSYQKDIKLEIKNKDTFIETLQYKIKVMEKKITYLSKNQVKDLKPPELYKKARNLLIEENYLIAGDLFIDFLKKFPEHDLADNAAYWLGECYYSLSEFKKAITIFKNLVTKYPKSGKVPGAMLKTGYAYLSLDDSNRAHHYLKKVLRNYPFSPAAEKAQEKLKNFE